MNRLLTSSRYIILIGVVGLLLGAFAGFALALVETIQLVLYVATHLGDPHLEVQEVYFIKLVDGFLISTGLLIFGLGLYGIFFGPLELPESLKFSSLGQLKTSLASIIALTLAVTFLTLVQEKADAQTVLFNGIAVAAVIGVLIFFARARQH